MAYRLQYFERVILVSGINIIYLSKAPVSSFAGHFKRVGGPRAAQNNMGHNYFDLVWDLIKKASRDLA